MDSGRRGPRLMNWMLLLTVLAGTASAQVSADEELLRFEAVAAGGGPTVSQTTLEAARRVVEARVNGGKLFGRLTVRLQNDAMITVNVANVTAERVAEIAELAVRPGTLEFAIAANSRDHAELLQTNHASGRPAMNNVDRLLCWLPVKESLEPGTESVVTRTAPSDKSDNAKHDEVLVVFERMQNRVTGAQLKSARAADSGTGTPAVAVELNQQGEQRMRRLTRANQPEADGFSRRMAVIVDGEIVMLPSLRAEIGGSALITGRFSDDEVAALVHVLRSGQLPVELRRVP